MDGMSVRDLADIRTGMSISRLARCTIISIPVQKNSTLSGRPSII